jgi:hypothetical protein
MRWLLYAGFVTLAFCAPAAFADEIYKSTMRDGSVRYGEAPEYGARQVKKIPAPPNSTGTITVTAHEKGRNIVIPDGGTIELAAPARKRPEPAQQGRVQIRDMDLTTRSY